MKDDFRLLQAVLVVRIPFNIHRSSVAKVCAAFGACPSAFVKIVRSRDSFLQVVGMLR